MDDANSVNLMKIIILALMFVDSSVETSVINEIMKQWKRKKCSSVSNRKKGPSTPYRKKLTEFSLFQNVGNCIEIYCSA